MRGLWAALGMQCVGDVVGDDEVIRADRETVPTQPLMAKSGLCSLTIVTPTNTLQAHTPPTPTTPPSATTTPTSPTHPTPKHIQAAPESPNT